MAQTITEIIRGAREQKASDIHLVCGLPVRIRVDGDLIDYGYRLLSDEECEALARELIGNENYKLFEEVGEFDYAGTYDQGVRCRANVFRQQGHVSSAIRILNDHIPKFETLGLPDIVETFAAYPRGIVLVTGETGSGKSTTLAALLNRINQTKRKHIITLEDPIEYIYLPDKCTINQREVGADTASYEAGLRAVLREDPDVILIGEMRSLDTIDTALTAAETGHLVFATLHTNSASDSVDRIISVFPAEKQQQVRVRLASTLRAVVSQQLLRKKNGEGRLMACEVMVVNGAIRNLIREAKTFQIPNIMATTAMEGNITMDNDLLRLVRSNQISDAVALEACHDAEYLRKTLGVSNSQSRNDRMMIIR